MNKRNWLRITLAMILALGMITVAQAEVESQITRQVGERFEGTIILEGMDETVQYEHIRNDTLGFEMDYDYENFGRYTGQDCERLISVWDNPDNPEIYIEITRSTEDAETTAVAVGETLSAEYEISTEQSALDGAGECIEIRAEVDHNNQMSIWQLQMVYIIPAENGGSLVVWGHYTVESAEGFGARLSNMINSVKIITINDVTQQ